MNAGARIAAAVMRLALLLPVAGCAEEVAAVATPVGELSLPPLPASTMAQIRHAIVHRRGRTQPVSAEIANAVLEAVEDPWTESYGARLTSVFGPSAGRVYYVLERTDTLVVAAVRRPFIALHQAAAEANRRIVDAATSRGEHVMVASHEAKRRSAVLMTQSDEELRRWLLTNHARADALADVVARNADVGQAASELKAMGFSDVARESEGLRLTLGGGPGGSTGFVRSTGAFPLRIGSIGVYWIEPVAERWWLFRSS